MRKGWQANGPTKHSVARKTPCGCGIVHDSAKEQRRCMELSLLERAGEITHLERQPFYPFVIAGETVKMLNGQRAGVTLDFSYRTADGAMIAEDVKPKSRLADSRDWPLRKAIFKHLHRSIELREIR